MAQPKNDLYLSMSNRSYDELLHLILDNLDYFRRNSSSYSDNFLTGFSLILENLQWVELHIDGLKRVAHNFDFDDKTPGNGYRSFISILDSFLLSCIRLCRGIFASRESFFFRTDRYYKELEAHASVLMSLRTGLVYLMKMLSRNKLGELFSTDDHLTAEELFHEYGSIDQTGFYGRCHGFYYCESMQKSMQGVGVIMASFSELYQQPGGALAHALASLLCGGKYILNPELRAQQIVYVAQNASVEYVKAFWSLSETHFMKQVPGWLCSKLAINQEIYVPAVSITVKGCDGQSVEVPAPSAHIAPAPVRCRLLSYTNRKGHNSMDRDKTIPPSPALLLHCHGGGFIAQSPESHEIYLREWAKELNVPILSVDYSLSPGAPFPRALEEVLLVYAWCLQNYERLGWTGEYICFAGDSAGGNILMGMALKTVTMKMRKPDAVFCAYTPLILDLLPSPSRLLCALDPLLPLGFMLSCLDAYGGIKHIEDDEYTTEEPAEQERPLIVRERKSSKLANLIDSSITLIKEFEQMDVEGNSSANNSLDPFLVVSNSGEIKDQSDIAFTEENSSNQSYDDDTVEESVSNSYLTNFMNKYMSLSSGNSLISTEVTSDDEHIIFEIPSDLSFSLHRKCCRIARHYIDKISDVVTCSTLYKKHVHPFLANESKKPLKGLAPNPWFQSHQNQTLAKKFHKMKMIASNPFMSPLLACDSTLMQMPPIYILSLNFDPTLDDSVMFARRLRNLGQPVCLDILDKLPHGFLNFIPFSKEAHEGSKLCIMRLKEALHLN